MQIHLNTWGTYLHIHDQLFEVKIKKEGKVEKHQIAAHKIKSIWIGQGIALSSEAVHLSMKHNIDIVFLERNGTPIGRVWHSKLGSTTLIRKKQLEASLCEQALHYTKIWIIAKVEHQLTALKNLKKHRSQHQTYLSEKIERVTNLQQSLSRLEGRHLDYLAGTIRGLEGTASRLYFETLNYVLSPPYQFSGRSFRPAKDAFNALLNYAYGVLYSRVEKSLMLAGLDPYVGFLHRDDYNYKSMVYDFIEPYRGYADKVVFSLLAAKKVNQSHTQPITNGVTLTKEGKVLLIEQLNTYLEEDKIRYKGRNQTRANCIQYDAHHFANELIGKNQEIPTTHQF
jgi:CRISPR-associated protein Cas1